MSAQQLTDLLYAIGMESPTAWAKMPKLCEALGVKYPPERTAEQLLTEINHE